jgi:hypothetical protein
MGERCPKNVILYEQRGEHSSIMCNPLCSDRRTVVICHNVLKFSVFLKAETLLTVPVLNVSAGMFHTLSAERTGITLDSM